jgi:small subunit ribosomal protein S16
MKQMGRRNRRYYRIVAIDHKQPRDGRVIEELGSYDPSVSNKDERVKLSASRIKYWLGVGALPTHKVGAFLKKYLTRFEEQEAQAAAAPAAAPAGEQGAAPAE